MMRKLSTTKLIVLKHICWLTFGFMLGEILGSQRIPLILNWALLIGSGVLGVISSREEGKRDEQTHRATQCGHYSYQEE